MAPKYPRDLLLKVKIDYETNNFTSVYELAKRHNIHPTTLHGIIERKGWKINREESSRELERKVADSREEQVQKYLKKSFLVAETYEKLVKVSMEQLSGKDSQGNHIIDPDSLDTYSKISQRSFEMGKSALRIPDVSQVDVSGKVSIEHSLVATIAKLREAKEKPALSSEDVSKYIDVEILPKSPSSS